MQAVYFWIITLQPRTRRICSGRHHSRYLSPSTNRCTTTPRARPSVPGWSQSWTSSPNNPLDIRQVIGGEHRTAAGPVYDVVQPHNHAR